jgi:hypothetical protein
VPEQAVLFGNCERIPVKLKPDLYVGIPRAASYAFQAPNSSDGGDEDPGVTLSSTAIIKYVGIEKRDGLISIGKRLLQGAQISSSYMPSLICAIRYSSRQPKHSLAEEVSS